MVSVSESKGGVSNKEIGVEEVAGGLSVEIHQEEKWRACFWSRRVQQKGGGLCHSATLLEGANKDRSLSIEKGL